jgi:hypothetical protein
MLRGLDRLALNVRIADSEAVLNPGSRLPFCKRIFLRTIVIQLRFLLRLRTLPSRKA